MVCFGTNFNGLKAELNYNDEEIKVFIKNVMEQYFKFFKIIPNSNFENSMAIIEDHFKDIDIISDSILVRLELGIVEDHFKNNK